MSKLKVTVVLVLYVLALPLAAILGIIGGGLIAWWGGN